MIIKMDDTKREEGNEEKEEGKETSNKEGASKFGLTSTGTVVMDENDFCLQYFRSMECWKRPVQGSCYSNQTERKISTFTWESYSNATG